MFVCEITSVHDKAVCKAILKDLNLSIGDRTSLGTVSGINITRTRTVFIMFAKDNEIHTYSVKAVRVGL